MLIAKIKHGIHKPEQLFRAAQSPEAYREMGPKKLTKLMYYMSSRKKRRFFHWSPVTPSGSVD
jgi:hypothetical protein